MKRLIFALLMLSIVAGCTNKDKTRQLLESHGMTNIEVGGYALWGCSEDDEVRTKFRATTATGQEVSGVVCSGILFKGATIRYD